MEEKRYDIDVERDVFIDRAVQTVINYENLIDNMGIDKKDIDNPVIIRYEEVARLSNAAYDFKTYEEIDDAEEKLDEIRRYHCELQ